MLGITTYSLFQKNCSDRETRQWLCSADAFVTGNGVKSRFWKENGIWSLTGKHRFYFEICQSLAGYFLFLHLFLSLYLCFHETGNWSCISNILHHLLPYKNVCWYWFYVTVVWWWHAGSWPNLRFPCSSSLTMQENGLCVNDFTLAFVSGRRTKERAGNLMPTPNALKDFPSPSRCCGDFSIIKIFLNAKNVLKIAKTAQNWMWKPLTKVFCFK